MMMKYCLVLLAIFIFPCRIFGDYLGMMSRTSQDLILVFKMDTNGRITFTQQFYTNSSPGRFIYVSNDGTYGVLGPGDVLTSFIVDDQQQVHPVDFYDVEAETGGQFFGIYRMCLADKLRYVIGIFVPASIATLKTLHITEEGLIQETGFQARYSGEGIALEDVPLTNSVFDIDVTTTYTVHQFYLNPDGSITDPHITFCPIPGPEILKSTARSRTLVGLCQAGGQGKDIIVFQGDEDNNFHLSQGLVLPNCYNPAYLCISNDDRYVIATFEPCWQGAVLLKFNSNYILELKDTLYDDKNVCAITPDSKFAIIGEVYTVGHELRVYKITPEDKLQLIPENTIFLPYGVADVVFIPPKITSAINWNIYY